MAKTELYDVADYLTNDELILAYLEEAFDTNDPHLIAKAIAAVARVRSKALPSDDGGENALQALSTVLREGESIDLKTAFQALRALGFRLTPVLREEAPLAA